MSTFNTMEKIELFKELLSVPTYSRKEERMIDFILFIQ